VDQLQNVYEVVFGILLYPGWLNGSNYERTPEETGIVPISSVKLRAAINELALPDLKLSRDLRYLAERTGVKEPALPWQKDRKILSRLLLETPGKVDPEKLCYDILQHIDGKEVFPKLAVYNRRQLKVMEQSSRIRDAMKKNQKALKRLETLNQQLLEVTDEADFLVDNDKAQDANGAEGEGDAVAAEQVENAGTAKQGESIGAVERQENMSEPDLCVGGAPGHDGAPATNQLPHASISRQATDATATIHKKRRQLMVPQRPSDLPGIDPRAFRSQDQHYVGAYPFHVEPPVPDLQKRKGTGRQGDRTKQARRKCKSCGRSDCSAAKTRVRPGESKARQYPPASSS
jgi:hypothetical protein